MRLSRFLTPDGKTRTGLIDGQNVLEIEGPWQDMAALFAAMPSETTLRGAVVRSHALDRPNGIVFLPPTQARGRIFCVGLNYARHIRESGREAPAHPSIFLRLDSSLVGHLQPIIRPSISEMFDFEGELAVIIGKPGHRIPVAKAYDHVAGYTCFAENSVRDWQKHGAQVTAGKNFDASGSIGPWIATADEVGAPEALEIVTRLNGTEMQRDSVGTLIFPIPELIAYISSFCAILPGDVIATGTPDGVGSARKPPVWMRPGDLLEVEIDRVGTLRNPVVAEEELSKSSLV